MISGIVEFWNLSPENAKAGRGLIMYKPASTGALNNKRQLTASDWFHFCSKQGGKFTEVFVRRANCHRDFFSTQTLCEVKFFAGDRRCFSVGNAMKSW